MFHPHHKQLNILILLLLTSLTSSTQSQAFDLSQCQSYSIWNALYPLKKHSYSLEKTNFKPLLGTKEFKYWMSVEPSFRNHFAIVVYENADKRFWNIERLEFGRIALKTEIRNSKAPGYKRLSKETYFRKFYLKKSTQISKKDLKAILAA